MNAGKTTGTANHSLLIAIEWLAHVPERQKPMVREIFEELVEIRHQIHKAKKLLEGMRMAMESFDPMTRRLNNQQLAVKDEVSCKMNLS